MRYLFLLFVLAAAALPVRAQQTFYPHDEPCDTIYSLDIDISDVRELEEMCFTRQRFNGVDAIARRPVRNTRDRIEALSQDNPGKAFAIPLLAKLELMLGNSERAEELMSNYPEAAGESADSYLLAAHFYHERLMYKEEISALEKAAGKQEPADAKDTWFRIIDVIEKNLVDGKDGFDYFRKMTALWPDDAEILKEYINALEEAGRAGDAIAAVDDYHEMFPGHLKYYLSEKSSLLVAAGRSDEAEALYADSIHPMDTPGLVDDYFRLLESNRKLRVLRESLQEKSRGDSAEWSDLLLLFRLYMFSNRRDSARELLDNTASGFDISKQGADRAHDIAGLYMELYDAERAIRFYYSAYIEDKSPESRENSLYRIYIIFRQRERNKYAGTPASLGELLNVRHADSNPSIAGGLLSLALNDRGLSSGNSRVESASVAYFNSRAAHNIFRTFVSGHPGSKRVPSMYMDEINALYDYRKYEPALALADEFCERWPGADEYYDVMLLKARGLALKMDYQQEVEVFENLLSRAAGRGDDSHYNTIMDRYAGRLIERKQYAKVVALYWNEIEKRPENPELYHRLLDYASEYGLFEEELAAYRKAVKHFDDRTWSHRLARWYIRHNKRQRFEEMLDDAADTFSDSDLYALLMDTAYRGVEFAGRDFYGKLYRKALRRFPYDPRFARRLMSFHINRDNYRSYGELAVEYYMLDPGIGEELLRLMSSGAGGLDLERALDNALEKCRSAPAEAHASALFAADALAWKSDYESALDLYENYLLAPYTGDSHVMTSAAELYRSLDRSFNFDSMEFTEKSARLYSELARIYPRNTGYATLAGEVLAEAGRNDAAAVQWKQIIDIERGSSYPYLETATLLWDYFMFDRALATLKKARETLDDNTLFTTEIAAVLESMDKHGEAIEEYVSALNHESVDRFGIIDRLTYLARNRGFEELIARRFQSGIESVGTWRLATAYGDYLGRLGRDGEKNAFYERVYDDYSSIEFMEQVYSFFTSSNNVEYQEKTLRYMFEFSGWKPAYYRRLVSLYKKDNRIIEAVELYRTVTEKYRRYEPGEGDYLSALLEAAYFCWNEELYHEAFRYFDRAIEVAPDRRKPQLKFDVAEKRIRTKQYRRAVSLLDELLSDEPQNVKYFKTLADAYIKMGRLSALDGSFNDVLSGVAALEYPASVRKSIRNSLRIAYIEKLESAGRSREAHEQYIEALNADPLDEQLAADAYSFSRKHKMTDVLLGFYEKTAERSHRDYRWHMLLGFFAIEEAEWKKAIGHFRDAVKVQPQRKELYLKLADTALKSSDYEEALFAYENLRRLDETADWAVQVSKMHARLGDRDKAIATLEQLIENDPPAFNKYFKAAEIFDGWGYEKRAVDSLSKGFDKYIANPYLSVMDGTSFELAAGIFVNYGELKRFYAIVDRLDELLERENAKKTNFERHKIKSVQNVLKKAEWETIPETVSIYRRKSDIAMVSGRLLEKLDEAKSPPYARALKAAEIAGFETLELDVLQDKKNYYYRKYTSDNNYLTPYRSAVNDIVDYYKGNFNYAGAVVFLESELSSVKKSSDWFLAAISGIHRTTGDTDSELFWLEKHFNYYNNDSIERISTYFDRSNPHVLRYLTLLHERDDVERFDEMAASRNRYSGLLLNFLVNAGRAEPALDTIDISFARMAPVWKNTNKSIVALELGLTDPAFGDAYTSFLGLEPVGAMLDSRPDRDIELLGDPWFNFSFNYAGYLHSTGSTVKAGGFAPSLLEKSPLAQDSYLRTGDYYFDKGRFADALENYMFAAGKGEWTNSLRNRAAKCHLAMGDRSEAFAQWHNIITGRYVRLNDYIDYYSFLDDAGFGDKGFQALSDAVKKAASASYLDHGFNDALVIASDYYAGDAEQFVDMLVVLVENAQNGVSMFDRITGVVSPDRSGYEPLYRKAIATAGDTGGDDWKRLTFDLASFLYDIGKYEKARREINTLLETGPGMKYVSRAVLLRVQCLAALNLKTELRAAVDNYLEKHRDLKKPDHNSLYRTLLRLGFHDEAHSAMLKYFQDKDRKRITNSDYTELARIYFELGRKEDAHEALQEMIYRTAINREGMELAAGLYEDYDQLKSALDLRKRLSGVAPGDYANKHAIHRLEFKIHDDPASISKGIQAAVSESAPYDAALEFADFIDSSITFNTAKTIISDNMEALSNIEYEKETVPFIKYVLYTKAGDGKAAVNALEQGIERLDAAPLLHALKAARLADSAPDKAMNAYIESFMDGRDSTDTILDYADFVYINEQYSVFIEVIKSTPVNPEKDIAHPDKKQLREYLQRNSAAGIGRRRLTELLEKSAEAAAGAGDFTLAARCSEYLALLEADTPGKSDKYRTRAEKNRRMASEISDRLQRLERRTIHLDTSNGMR